MDRTPPTPAETAAPGAPQLPPAKQGDATAGLILAGVVVLVIGLIAVGWRLLDFGDSRPEPAGTVSGDAEPEAAAPMAVPAIGATAPALEAGWEPSQADWQEWRPFDDTDVRSLATSADAVGFIGLGVLDETTVPFDGDTGVALEAIADVIRTEYLGPRDGLAATPVATTPTEIDGYTGAVGEFSLEWDDAMADGDTRADYAVVIAELDDGTVFAGFMGLFASQNDHYDPALQALLAVTFDH